MNNLAAGIGFEAPELPSFITLLHKGFLEYPIVHFLHDWDAIVFSTLIAGFIILIFRLGSRKKALIPGPFQNGLEWFVESFRGAIIGILGPVGDQYVPFLGTLFLYILVMNLFGIVPFMQSPSANLNVTAALAICVFVLVQYLNIKNMGFFGFLHHLAGSPKTGVQWALAPLLFVIELITQVSRPLTLAFRLFGNILGEDILIGIFALMGVGLAALYYIPIGFPIQIPFIFLGILTSLMQALVFTLLSTIYILLSLGETHE